MTVWDMKWRIREPMTYLRTLSLYPKKQWTTHCMHSIGRNFDSQEIMKRDLLHSLHHHGCECRLKVTSMHNSDHCSSMNCR